MKELAVIAALAAAAIVRAPTPSLAQPRDETSTLCQRLEQVPDQSYLLPDSLAGLVNLSQAAVVSPVQPVPVGMSVFTADQWDEPDKAEHAPHERVRGSRHDDGRQDHESRQENRVERRHVADGNPAWLPWDLLPAGRADGGHRAFTGINAAA
jgi:hypothetical protein